MPAARAPRLLPLLALALAAPALAAAAPPRPPSDGALPGRLPAGVRPTHYELELTPDAGALTFTGRADVDVEVARPTRSITLNARDLALSNATVGRAGVAPLPATVTVDAARQTATLALPTPLAAGAWRLHLDFAGPIAAQQPSGLFAVDPGGDARQRSLYTNFEPGDARRLFPSFDEPSAKATFAVTVLVPRGWMVVGNMPVAERSALPDGRDRVRLAVTPRMSTYLLFLGMGDLERTTAKVGDVEVGIVTRRGLAAQGAFALASLQEALRDEQEYFGIAFPLPKLDDVAAPGHSLLYGAMENWGAIQSFERSLLLDPALASDSERQHIFTGIAHETAHQWLGDLVTLEWWDDLWLNEGFASWMEGRATERLHPDWRTDLQAVGSRDAAMRLDALPTSHAIVQRIDSVEEANGAFDSITYLKSESVLRMLEAYVGPETWRAAVRDYLRAHAYGTARSADLWRAVEAASRRPVVAIARDFVEQPGVPLVRVEGSRCVGGRTEVTLAQDELRLGAAERPARRWRVPVLLRTLGGEPAAALIEKGTATATLPGCGPLLVNAGQSGYFRTLYDRGTFAALAGAFARLDALDQLGLLSDGSALGMAGLAPVSDPLALALATPADAAPQVWSQVASTLLAIDARYPGDTPERRRFRAFARGLLAPVVARLGWEALPGEGMPTALLRGTLLSAAAALGDPQVIAEAHRRFAAEATDPAAMPPALRLRILAIVARHADAATWEELHRRAREAKSAVLRDQLYVLLGAAEDESLARRALDLALGDEAGPSVTPLLVSRVSSLHPELALDFALAHRAAIEARVEPLARPGFLPGLAHASTLPATRARVLALAGPDAPPELRQEVAEAAATIAEGIRVRTERLPEIDAWLAAREKVGAASPAGRSTR